MANNALIVMVLDRSGSMESIRDDTIGGVNSFLEEQRKVPGKCWVTLAQFNHTYELLQRNVPLEEIRPLTKDTFVPSGNTALLDAMDRAITTVDQDLTQFTPENKPDKVYFITVTDGQDNSSMVTREKVFNIISDKRKNCGWEFVFLAANQDAIAAGNSYGISQGTSLSYNADSMSTRGSYGVVSNHITTSRNTGQSISFTDQDRKDALGNSNS